MRRAAMLTGIARAASAARRMGLVDHVRWMKPAVRRLVGEMTVRQDGYVLGGDLDHWELLEQLRRGAFERQTRQRFSEAVRPGATVLDLGAHIGAYTLLAAALVGPSGRVIAFEPDPRSFAWLRRNIRRNRCRHVTPIQQAVADRSGSATLFSHPLDPSQNSLHAFASPRASVAVETVALDARLPAARVDVVKMDIEGGEVRALQGMQALLEANPAVTLFVELNPAALRRAGSSGEELVAWLRQAGFRVARLDERYRADGSLLAANLHCVRMRPGRA
jgi:FkbM family methyltransferase